MLRRRLLPMMRRRKSSSPARWARFRSRMSVRSSGSTRPWPKRRVRPRRSVPEQLERFGITQIYDLVSQVPGTFTSSFFGTGGALDIRGTPGEVYFRGMLRLENPGNYPTPIAAADRIDIVRGPASPIYGPSKTGGYMNFVPKTARAANGTYPVLFMSQSGFGFPGLMWRWPRDLGERRRRRISPGQDRWAFRG